MLPLCWWTGADAERLSFKVYGASQGLQNLGGGCLLQDPAGYILTCSDHGMFAYDGRRFSNLGPAQGLRDGGIVFDAVVLADGRLAIRYADQVFVSDRPSRQGTSPLNLHFEPVLPDGLGMYNIWPGQMVPWRRGLALIVGTRAVFVSLSAPGRRAKVEPIARAPDGRASGEPRGVFVVRDTLWETFDDARVCAVDPGPVRCWSAPEEARLGPFEFVGAGDHGRVLARSRYALATLDPSSTQMTIEPLPFQGGPYSAYTNKVELFRDPEGNLATQAADGLIVRHGESWLHLINSDGVPSGVISHGLSDRDKQLWLQVTGRGLFRGLEYGRWEGFQASDGLSAGLPWEVVRDATGSLWISTDTGVDQVESINGRLQTVNVLPGPAFALALSPDGSLWSSTGSDGLLVTDMRTKVSTHLSVPAVDAITAGRGRMWVGTDHGLFSVGTRDGAPTAAVRASPDEGQITAVVDDGDDGAYFVAADVIWHRHADGTLKAVIRTWPVTGYQPLTLIKGPDDTFWAGGSGGLFRLRVVGDRLESIAAVGRNELGSNTVTALCLDRRGWLWVGTGMGLSVFNGRDWLSINESRGLVWNDVSQNGLYEDTDGSMWIATSQGVSHFLKPASLFSPDPLTTVISKVELGSALLASRKIRYGNGPLTIDLGTVSFVAEDSTVFRYRLSGVDEGWAETTSGSIRYPTLTSGRHVFEAYAVDTLTSARSRPVSFTFEVAFPWWRSWWAEAGYCAGGALVLYLITSLWAAAARSRRSELAALAQLRQQATTDVLTGLLNRAELERRLAETLLRPSPRPVLLAVIDIDHFKAVNDEHGHLVGDAVIRTLGRQVADILDEGDYAGRFGGEELLLILDDTAGDGAARIRRFHHGVRRSRLFLEGRTVTVTCSIGLAWSREHDTWESLVGRADAALYAAKRAGRDRIMEDRARERPAGGLAESTAYFELSDSEAAD